MILAKLVAAWFMQRDGKAGVHHQETFCAVVFAPLLHVHAACTVQVTEKCYSVL
jgi:hypothetical protein